MADISTVEFGPRKFQLANALRRDLVQGELAFVEKDSTYIEPLQAKLNEEGIRAKVIHGDAQDIDFRKENIPLAATIFAKDLFGQAGLYEFTRHGMTGNKVELNFDLMVENWKRNSTPNAKVVVLEVATPTSKQDLKDIFKRHGYDVAEEYKGEDMKKIFDQENPDIYTRTAANSSVKIPPPDAFAIVFEKVKP